MLENLFAHTEFESCVHHSPLAEGWQRWHQLLFVLNGTAFHQRSLYIPFNSMECRSTVDLHGMSIATAQVCHQLQTTYAAIGRFPLTTY